MFSILVRSVFAGFLAVFLIASAVGTVTAGVELYFKRKWAVQDEENKRDY